MLGAIIFTLANAQNDVLTYKVDRVSTDLPLIYSGTANQTDAVYLFLNVANEKDSLEGSYKVLKEVPPYQDLPLSLIEDSDNNIQGYMLLLKDGDDDNTQSSPDPIDDVSSGLSVSSTNIPVPSDTPTVAPAAVAITSVPAAIPTTPTTPRPNEQNQMPFADMPGMWDMAYNYPPWMNYHPDMNRMNYSMNYPSTMNYPSPMGMDYFNPFQPYLMRAPQPMITGFNYYPIRVPQGMNHPSRSVSNQMIQPADEAIGGQSATISTNPAPSAGTAHAFVSSTYASSHYDPVNGLVVNKPKTYHSRLVSTIDKNGKVTVTDLLATPSPQPADSSEFLSGQSSSPAKSTPPAIVGTSHNYSYSTSSSSHYDPVNGLVVDPTIVHSSGQVSAVDALGNVTVTSVA